ncbi:MAG: DUF1844 domain-containing protein [Deltaproteobacteria bacterium]|nr:DUF1844 domain-containing protein [Deltaproteobacteria bacterium]
MSDNAAEKTDSQSCEDSIRQGEVAFNTFILSLGTSVLVHLGLGNEAGLGKEEANLPLARHVIDILTMLREKTAGNLEEDEQKLIDQLLFDLRLKFVEACNAHKGEQTETKE